jgi:hypothetical protein
VSAGLGCVDHQWCEALHPAIDRDVSQASFMSYVMTCVDVAWGQL